MFEYQTAICELTGLPVSNASVYDGPSALASAGYLARLNSDRRRFLVSRGVHPQAREALATSSAGWGTVVEEVDLSEGATDVDALSAALGDDVAAVFLAQPNFLGAVEDLEPLVQAARAAGALVVLSCDPIALGILRTPGELGVDVAVGEGQPLGNRLDFGGPSFGFFAAREEHLRRLPGRIAGETRDADGRRGFVLTLQTREQHIRREKATHNICTAQALNALAALIHLSWLGRQGLVELAESLVQRTAYARERLCAIPGVEALHHQPVVREFAVSLDAPVEAVIERCADAGINPGHALERDYPELEGGLLVAVTERRTRADIDRLADVLAAAVAAERHPHRQELAA
jgi:glycine dehydrogenase subunit 1